MQRRQHYDFEKPVTYAPNDCRDEADKNEGRESKHIKEDNASANMSLDNGSYV